MISSDVIVTEEICTQTSLGQLLEKADHKA
jgi:hypothetical protein